MKFRNDTKWTDSFLKNLIRWCCAELGMPAEAIMAANFGIHKDPEKWAGRANYRNMSIYIRVGGWIKYPTRSAWNEKSKRADPFWYHDEIEVLVNITAHEISHLHWHHDGRSWDGTEGDIQGIGDWIVRVFRPQREELLRTWEIPEGNLRSAATSQ